MPSLRPIAVERERGGGRNAGTSILGELSGRGDRGS